MGSVLPSWQGCPKSAPRSVGQIPRGLTEGWHALAKTAAQVFWEPPRPSPGAEGEGQHAALPGSELPGSHLEQAPAGGRVSWLSGEAPLSFTVRPSFLLMSSSQLLFVEVPMVPDVSRGVPPLPCSIPPRPSYFTGRNGSSGRSSLLPKVTAGEKGVRIQIWACLTRAWEGQVSLGQAPG